jgi:hypothetical protein
MGDRIAASDVPSGAANAPSDPVDLRGPTPAAGAAWHRRCPDLSVCRMPVASGPAWRQIDPSLERARVRLQHGVPQSPLDGRKFPVHAA